MTIISTRDVKVDQAPQEYFEAHPPGPAAKVYAAAEPPFKGYHPPQADGYRQSAANPNTTAIVIDNGSSLLKAGWSFDKNPRFVVPPCVSKYRDRKLNKPCLFVGYDAFADATTRGQIRNAFEPGSGVVSNWDVMEGMLDYVFLKLGVDGSQGGVGRPIVMTEPLANLGYSRRMMNEVLFECYTAPSVTYGIDSLFSYRYNKGRDGLIISSAHAATHVIPVLDSKPQLMNSSRLNWGGTQSQEYLQKLLRLKYREANLRLADYQMEDMIRKFCYMSLDYDRETRSMLEYTGLEDRDVLIQYPFTEHLIVEKTEEELARAAERKKESGRRLQEQAAKQRLEKLIKKEQELEYYRDLQQGLESQTKKEVKRILEAEDMKDEAHLERTMRELDKSIRKSRNKDLGIEEAVKEVQEQTFPLLDVPDDQLDEAGIKEKRQQRLMKSGVEARQRAKAEKEREKARIAEEARLDTERRENNFESWVEERRAARDAILTKIKERDRLKADLGNRKSLASQMRMKTLANLASDGPKKRRRGGEDDTFGANDDDWGVYRTVQADPDDEDDEEEDLGAGLKSIEAQLLQYDPSFTENNTLDAQSDWTKSLKHAFLHGPRLFDNESPQEAHQVHLNVERIRIPEVVFQPSIAGVDQAGIVEIVADILLQRISMESVRSRLLKDVFLTGGNTLFRNFDQRLTTELHGVIPAGAELAVRRAQDPVLDAWKGASQWWTSISGSSSELAKTTVLREEYLERGSEYMKEHNLGNTTASTSPL